MHASLLLLLSAAIAQPTEEKIVFSKKDIQVRVALDWSSKKPARQLLDTHIMFGTQMMLPTGEGKDAGDDFRRLPTSYYHPGSPLGRVLHRFNWFNDSANRNASDARGPASVVGLALSPFDALTQAWSEPPVAVLGMGIATVAAYGRPMQTMDFFEPKEAIVKLSLPSDGGETYFTYAKDAMNRGVGLTTHTGPLRETFAKTAGDGFYRVIVVETHKVPSCELHMRLLTVEGLAELMTKVHDEGIVCYHISHRYTTLTPVIAAAAKKLNLQCLEGNDMAAQSPGMPPGATSSTWVMVSRNAMRLTPPPNYKSPFATGPFWMGHLPTQERYMWTDAMMEKRTAVYTFDPALWELRMRFKLDYGKYRSLDSAIDEFGMGAADRRNEVPHAPTLVVPRRMND